MGSNSIPLSAPSAQKVYILHKKPSLSGTLCAKPAGGMSITRLHERFRRIERAYAKMATYGMERKEEETEKIRDGSVPGKGNGAILIARSTPTPFKVIK